MAIVKIDDVRKEHKKLVRAELSQFLNNPTATNYLRVTDILQQYQEAYPDYHDFLGETR
jgi:hypothetical protein